MAVDGERIHENSGRRRGFQRKKLLVNEKVEVRSVEDGFLGSWHPGTVIRSGRQRRHVRYDNLLDNKEVHYLEEVVEVSNVLDGIPSSLDSCYQRGFIRPVPPPVQFDERELQFGICIDAYYKEAWWEGVVFDYSNGSKERSVFFPDLGDEMRVQIDQLRITQDWDEATGNWEPRGKWVMLELYEECHRKSYVPISIKQIWYDVRTREDFNNIGEWTRNVKDLWREPVMEVIDDYYILTLKQLQTLLNLPEDFSKGNGLEVETDFGLEAVAKYYLNALEKNQDGKREWKLKAQNHLLAEGWVIQDPTEMRRTTLYFFPRNNFLGTLQGACRVYLKEKVTEWNNSGRASSGVNVDHVGINDLLLSVSQMLEREPQLDTIDVSSANTSPDKSSENKKRKSTKSSNESTQKRQRNDEFHKQESSPMRQRNDESSTQELKSSKRVQEVVSPSVAPQKPQSVLSWLIENKKVSPRYKVYCYSGKGGSTSTVTEGRITRDGIKCSCCQKLYGLGGFVNHANGSSDGRPCACIYLKDGRSLLQCMIEVMHEHRVGETMDNPTNYLFEGENDNSCAVCNYGGDLILCDRCPSSFHKNCLGLENIPDGDWFCPLCRCGSCGQINTEETGDEQLLTCVQCEHKYHVGCQRNKLGDNLGSCQENWLCSQECQKIHAGLRNLLGKEIIVGENGLTWTLLKLDNTDINSKAESYSKLSVALSVMHECFGPLENPLSARDLVEEVIFSRRSGFNRLNYQGFYTVLLERNDELICVATIRVFGEKVAEVPLVATRSQYRRLGMCRILMDELEKNLKQLGVERLVLPAVPQVLQTWINSFGFAEMTNLDRSQFVDYSFLDFEGTTWCQKMLTRKPSPDSVVTRGL